MKILIFAALISLASCLVDLPEEAKFAKTYDEHPAIKKALMEKNPELFNEDGEIISKTPFIIGGANAYLGQFPHQALLFTFASDGTYLCGGSLIRHNWVLTAAHCVYNSFIRISVYLGVIDSYNGPAHWGTNVTSRSDVKIHKSYNDNTLVNDIAMIYMKLATESILNSPYIRTINLPFNYTNTNLVGMSSIVSGFGLTRDGGQSSQFLKYVALNITSNLDCEKTYGSNIFRSTNICVASTRTASTCQGDSGGPLTVVLNGTTYVVGIVSFGAKDSCEIGYPTGFTRVTSYLGWIEKGFNMSPKTAAVNAFLLIIIQIFLFLRK